MKKKSLLVLAIFTIFIAPFTTSSKKLRGSDGGGGEDRVFETTEFSHRRQAHKFSKKHHHKYSKKYHHKHPIGVYALPLLLLPIPFFIIFPLLTSDNCACQEKKFEQAKRDTECECLCFCDSAASDMVPVLLDGSSYDVDPNIINPDDETCGCMDEDLYIDYPSTTNAPSSILNQISPYNPIVSSPGISPGALPLTPTSPNNGISLESTPTLNHLPIAEDDFYNTNKNSPITFSCIKDDSDVDEDELFVWSYMQPSNGLVILNSDGSLTYTPNLDFVGTDTFEYIVGDGKGGLDTGIVTIRVGL